METSPATPPPLPPKGQMVKETFKDNFVFLIGLVVILWGIEIADTVLLNTLDNFGIKPRHIPSVFGIASAPFLHLGFGHLASNTLPFFVLGGLVLLGGRATFISVSVLIAVLGGGLLWLLGPGQTNHIGASLVIFGYLGFLLTRGLFEKSGFWVLVSVVILIIYGSMIFGMLPGQPGISWQGHLFGFIAGVVSAKLLFSKEKTLYQ